MTAAGIVVGAGFVRYSKVLLAFERQFGAAKTEVLKKEVEAINKFCDEHGELSDPILCITANAPLRIVLGCPWCSDPRVLKQWQAEGP